MQPSSPLLRRATFTLHGDGSSDGALLPVLEWLLRSLDPTRVWAPQFADFSQAGGRPRPPREALARAIDLYPCDLLFVHRDQEAGTREERIAEIGRAAAGLPITLRVVPVVPTRMTEAWLLIDEAAIRKAAGNASGSVVLDLPAPRELESLNDPKKRLHDLLTCASELKGRRLVKLRVPSRVHDVARAIDDFSPLRTLLSFRALESDLANAVATLP